MKNKIIYIVVALAAMAVSCNKQEGIVPNDSDQPDGPVRTERLGLVLADNPGTKVNVDGTTGAITWIPSTDQIAVCIKTNTSYAYRTCSVNGDSAIEVDLANNQSREYYAVYPANVALSSYMGDSNPLSINYPSSYNLAGFTTFEAVSNYCPAPMVAINEGEVLNFYHVGSVLRLTLPDVPQGTTFIRIYFQGLNSTTYPINGTFTITNGGTPSCTATKASGGNAYLDFTLSSTLFQDAKHDLVLNIPLPPGNYSSVSKVSASYHKNGPNASYPYSNGFSTYTLDTPWAQSDRAVGRKVLLPSVIPGTFAGQLISGFCENNTVRIDYADRDDLYPLKAKKAGNIEYGYPRVGYYNVPSSASDAGYSIATVYQGSVNSTGVWSKVLGTDRGGSVVGGVKSCRYAYVNVTGLDNSVYGVNNIDGWLFFPDGCELSAIDGITYFNGTSSSKGSITQSTMNQLVQNPPYCIFMPFCGSYSRSGSYYTAQYTNYGLFMSKETGSSGRSFNSRFTGSSTITYATSYDSYSEYAPLRLIKNIFPQL